MDITVNANNDWELADCDDSTCTLDVGSDCTTSWAFTGYLTPFGTEEYDAVGNATQQAGL